MATPEEIRQRLIAIATQLLDASAYTPQFKAQCKTNLQKMSIEQIENNIASLAKANRDEAVKQLEQAEQERQEVRQQRHDDAAFLDIERGGPQRRQSAQQQAQAEREAIFAAACKATRTVGVTQANLGIITDALGPDFTFEAAVEFIETNGPTMMSGPSVHERNTWNHQDAQERQAKIAEQNAYRKNLPHEQLRAEVRAAGAQAHATQVAQEAQRQLQITENREQQSGMFQPLPKVLRDGTQVTSQYLIALSNSPYGSEGYKKFVWLCKATGFAAVTRRINGLD